MHHVDVDDSLWPNTIVSQTMWKNSQRYMKFNNRLLTKPYLNYEWKMENNIRSPWVKSSVVWVSIFKGTYGPKYYIFNKCGRTFRYMFFFQKC